MYAKYFKRGIDFILSLCALVVFSPIFLILIILGTIFMGGNPFFTQERPGKDEKIFKLIKFRTMNNKKDKEGKFLPDELRLNKYGKFLRASSLDELPELINILKGDMAIIGPRPLLVRYLDRYNEEQRHRHDVRPGLLYIYGKYMKERGKLLTNTVVTTVMSNFGLYKAFDELGIDYAKTAVGDKYVYEYMMKNGCRIGGEQSGHIIFSKYASTGDGILTSLKIMEVMMARKKKLSELAEGFTVYPQLLTNVRVTDKKAAQDDADVQAAVQQVANALGDTGRILVRESEPVVRVMVEAESEEVCRKYVDSVVDVIKEKGFAL